MADNLKPIAKQSIDPDEQSARAQRKPWPPGLSSSACSSPRWASRSEISIPRAFSSSFVTGILVICLMVVIQVWGGFVRCFVARHKDSGRKSETDWLLGILQAAWMSMAGGALTTGLMWATWRVIPTWQPWHVVAYAPALVAGAVVAGVMLLVGLMGADYPDAAREWTARTGARFAMLVVAWTALFALTIDGPPAVAELVHRLPRVGPAAIVTWIATTLGGVFAGRSPQTGNRRGEEQHREGARDPGERRADAVPHRLRDGDRGRHERPAGAARAAVGGDAAHAVPVRDALLAGADARSPARWRHPPVATLLILFLAYSRDSR